VNPEKPLNGIPVSLPVPTHLELVVTERNFWTVDGGKENKCPQLKLVSGCNATRHVQPIPCYTEKVFVVDPVKPGAGTQNYSFVFRSDDSKGTADGKTVFPAPLATDSKASGKGYLKGIKYNVDDRTITDSASLLSNVLGLVTAINSQSPDENTLDANNLVETSRVVAYGRFDINGVGFEEEVCAFLEQHVNQASKEFTCTTVCDSNCKDNCNSEQK
jgi:hypothetical protein